MKNIKEIIQGIINIGIPINAIARKVQKDGSTIGKWLRGQTNISDTLKCDLEQVATELNEEWQKIFN